MSYKAILMELVGTAYNIPDGELQELLKKPDAELTDADDKTLAETFKTRHRNVITSINKTAELKLDEKFKAGERKKAQEFEQSLRDIFGVDSKKQGQELIEDIKENLAASSGKNASELTDDDVKKHPLYIRAENDYKSKVKALGEEKDKAINDLKAEYNRKEVFGKVSKSALQYFEELKPVLSEDPKKAAAQKERFLKDMAEYEFEEIEGKIVVTKNGKVVEDEFGNKKDLQKIVTEVASLTFDFRVAEDRNSPNGEDGGKGKDDGGQGSSYKGKLPKTQAEYETMQNDQTIPLKDRMAINDYWAKQTATA